MAPGKNDSLTGACHYMSDHSSESTALVSESGIAAQHPALNVAPPRVAPTTSGTEFNRLKILVAPIACWRVDDLCFDFDASFPGLRIRAGLQHLQQLLAVHAPPSQAARKQPAESMGCPLSVFAHADPVGSDDYNKQLSGRRAMVIYGLLTHDATLWEKLYAQPLGHDSWGAPALRAMLEATTPAGGAGARG